MKQKPISTLDALGALALGAWVRFGAPAASALLQLTAMVLGVAGIVMILWKNVIAAVALFPAAWGLWYLGQRVGKSFSGSTLDQTKDFKPQHID